MSTQRLRKTMYILCAAVITVVMGCNKPTEQDSAPREVERIMIPVKGAVAQKRDITQTLNFSGNMDAFRRAAIAPAVMGSRVQRIFAEEGHGVREGQLLVQMEDFQLRQARTQLAQLEADQKRIAALYSRGSVTAQQYEQINTAYNAAKAGYELLKSSVELRAPFAGTVIGRYVNEGEVYTGAPGVDGISGVLAIAQLGRMKIEVMVPEQDFVHLRTGQVAHVRTDAYRDTVFEGRIVTINPSLNRMSRTARVAIEIANPNRLLKPGMFARVEIVTSRLKNVLSVPSTAVVTRDGAPHVFIVEGGATPFTTTPKLTPVKTGKSTNDLTQILDGVKEGDIVLTENNVSLSENTHIRVTDVVR